LPLCRVLLRRILLRRRIRLLRRVLLLGRILDGRRLRREPIGHVCRRPRRRIVEGIAELGRNGASGKCRADHDDECGGSSHEFYAQSGWRRLSASPR
jgi:hypothetical protein